jgi:hypothetical protein
MSSCRPVPIQAFFLVTGTLNRGRDGPKHFLKEYTEILLADAYRGYTGVVAGNAITRAGCWPTRDGSLWMRRKPHRRSHGRR